MNPRGRGHGGVCGGGVLTGVPPQMSDVPSYDPSTWWTVDANPRWVKFVFELKTQTC